MAREDRYAAGLATGAGVGAASYGAYRLGSTQQRKGRLKARSNAGSQGTRVRSERLVRQGSDMVRSGQKELGRFKRTPDKNGKVSYRTPSGGFAPTKALNEQISQGGSSAKAGRAGVGQASRMRASALNAVSRMKSGRLMRRGGIAGMAIGAGVAGGSIVAGERSVNRKRGNLRQMPVANAQSNGVDYRGMRSDASLVDAYGNRKPVPSAAAWLRENGGGR